MNRKIILVIVGSAAICLLLFGGLVALVLKPRPIACWLELRYTLEPADATACGRTADIVSARLKAAGFRKTEVLADGDGLLVRVPIREPRGRRAASAAEAAKARQDYLAAECDGVRKLIGTGAHLAFHKVDACGQPDASPASNTHLQYAYDEERWRKALAGEATPGFLLATHTDVYYSGPPKTEKLLLVAEPLADGSMLTRALAQSSDHGLGWHILVYLDAIGTARMERGTNPANMQHRRDRLAILLDGEVKSAPVVQDQLSGVFEITGRFTRDEAESLAMMLNSGALPCKPVLKSQQLLPPDSAK